MKTPLISSGNRLLFGLLAGTFCLAQTAVHAVAPFSLRYTGTDFEGRQNFQLEWTSAPNQTYLVQSADSLAASNSWQTIDAVTATNTGPVRWMAPEALRSQKYYRLVLPSPEISSIEPGVVNPSLPDQYLYILGQSLPTNAEVVIDGLHFTPEIINADGVWARISLNGLPPGQPVFGLSVVDLDTTNTVADWAHPFLTVDAAAPYLLEPPAQPPAAPMAAVLSRKGYDYYQARSDWQSRRTDGDCDDNDPRVRPFSGEVQACVVDMSIPGRGLDFVWARTYRSRTASADDTSGSRWFSAYDIRVQPQGGDVVIHDGTGRADTYFLQTNGTYTCPGFFREGTLSNQVFRLTFADTGYWEFAPLDGTATAGKLARIVDRHGNTMSLDYDGTGRLAQVVDDLGRTNTVSYNAGGQLAAITDFTGRTVTYAYYQSGETGGHPGDLKSVTSPPVTGTPNGNNFPAGKTTTYTYSSGYTNELENHLLLSVMDASGQIVRQFAYQHDETAPDFLRCLAVQRWTNTPATIRYLPQTPSPTNQFAVWRCVINDPEGNVTERFYDARNRCVTERDFTGRAVPGQPVTDTANRPANKLRASDPDYYETRWTWNEDSLCTSVAWPGGQSQFMVYQRAFNQNASRSNHAHSGLHNGDLRVIHEFTAGGQAVDFNGDGVADTAERVWRFAYDPRFGSEPAARNDMHDGIECYPGLVPAGNGVAINQKGTGADKGRITGMGTGKPVREWMQAVRSGNDPRRTMGEPNSSSPASFRGWDGIINSVAPADYTYPELHSHSHDTCTEDAFIVSATDPRGNVTTASYDGAGNCVQVARPEADTADFTYNAYGQLTAITNAPDANGDRRVDTLTYHASGPQAGYLQSIAIDEPGLHLTTSFDTDARGNVVRCVDPLGHDWLYTYNALDQCVRCETPTNIVARCATDFFYDANNHCVQRVQELRDATDKLQGQATRAASFDALHQLTRIVLAVDDTRAQTNDFAYNGNGQCVQVFGGDAVSGADPFQTRSYEYDERGLLFREIAARGSAIAATNEYDYDANGHTARVNKIDSFVIKQTVMTRDGFDRLASLTDPMGNQTVCFYDANNNVRTVRRYGETNDVPGSAGNIRLAETRYDYDALDRCVRAHELYFNPATQAPIGNGECATAFGWAPNGECFSRTNDLGHVTTFGYDTAGRLDLVTSPETRTSFAILLNGNGCGTNCSETDLSDLGGNPQIFSQSYVYDSLDRCISTTDNVGNATTRSYDSLDRCVQSVNPRGVRTFYSYDLLGRCTRAVGDLDGDGVPDLADDIVQSSTWSSSRDRLLAQTDSHTNTTSYNYDSLGRCTLITRADGTQCSLVWSPRSNLLREQDANGSIITNTYDLDDRLIHRDIAAQTTAGVADTTTFEAFEFDGCSRLVGEHDDDCDGYLTYDSLGNCRRETLNGLGTTSSYDPPGNRLSLTGPSGRTFSYSYDSLERCSAISESGKELAGYAYDGPGRVARVDLNNGMVTRVFYNGLAGAANVPGDYGWGQIRRVAHAVNGAGAVNDCAFTYDPNQNQALRSVLIPGASPRTNVMAFQYDAADRLREALVTDNATPARDTVYALDRTGNRTHVVGAACAGDYTLDGAALGPLDFQMNQYTATPCDSRIYDNNGNLVERDTAAGPVTYQYDYANRLVLVQALAAGAGTLAPVAAYRYDALGRRVYQIVYAGTTTNVTQFAYDGDAVIEEWNSGGVSASYVRDASHSLPGGVLSLRRNGKDFYLHADDQGNTVALTDANGAVVERYEYDDYGAVTFLAPDGTVQVGGDGLPVTASPAGNAYAWQGMRRDAETGLQTDDRAGYFDPASGRFINRDCDDRPGAIPGDWNNAGGNNPWSTAVAKISDFGMSRLNSAGLIHRDIAARNVLCGRFENGDVPNQDDFCRAGGGAMRLHHEGIVHRDLAARNILGSHFETGDRPTQEQLRSFAGALLHESEDRDLLGLRSDGGELCGETSHFIFAKEIGSGAFGRVFPGKWRNMTTAASPAGKTVEKFHVRQEFGPSRPLKR